MRMESIMWLFPIFFMIHDFEEIIFAKSWLEKNNDHCFRRKVRAVRNLAVMAKNAGMLRSVKSPTIILQDL